jgi:hypothetical protein
MSRRIRRRRQRQQPLSPPPLWPPLTRTGVQPFQTAARKPLISTPRQKQRRLLVAEIESLRREVSRLKEAQRDSEKMDDEVWIENGRIFFAHRCNGALLEQEISDGWKITSSGAIRPSFSCPACSAHFNATVIVQIEHVGWKKPADWAPRWEQPSWGQTSALAPSVSSTRATPNPYEWHPSS